MHVIRVVLGIVLLVVGVGLVGRIAYFNWWLHPELTEIEVFWLFWPEMLVLNICLIGGLTALRFWPNQRET